MRVWLREDGPLFRASFVAESHCEIPVEDRGAIKDRLAQRHDTNRTIEFVRKGQPLWPGHPLYQALRFAYREPKFTRIRLASSIRQVAMRLG